VIVKQTDKTFPNFFNSTNSFTLCKNEGKLTTSIGFALEIRCGGSNYCKLGYFASIERSGFLLLADAFCT